MQLNLDRVPDIGQMRLALHQHLRALEQERERVIGEIVEIERRIHVLNEIWSWALPEPQAEPVQPQDGAQAEYRLQNGDARLLGMGIADAIVYLQRENPEITKRQVRERLEAIGYRFGHSAVGRAIHAAWITANRRLREA